MPIFPSEETNFPVHRNPRELKPNLLLMKKKTSLPAASSRPSTTTANDAASQTVNSSYKTVNTVGSRGGHRTQLEFNGRSDERAAIGARRGAKPSRGHREARDRPAEPGDGRTARSFARSDEIPEQRITEKWTDLGVFRSPEESLFPSLSCSAPRRRRRMFWTSERRKLTGSGKN